MRKTSFILLIYFSLTKLSADESYRYFVNLNKVINDKVSVLLITPNINQEVVDFCFPSMVPGTYEIYDFGRFISNLKVLGKNKTKIKIEKIDKNTYRLSPASQIEKITYDVDDTWDECNLKDTKEKIIFEPGGTNFEKGKNFSINTHSMFGYFKGYSNREFILEFEKPKDFFPSTGLNNINIGINKDVISVFDYHDLVDSPIMYFIPDTATIKIAKTNVLVSCYSPNKKITAKFISETLKELLIAQKDYLGGELPVEKYAFLFYFMSGSSLSGSSGALEHSYSSFYVLPEYDSLSIQQQLRDVAAHEFFHIVTPLNIHAKEIGDFDFNNPQMSEHLWLYEGMTEYAAHHAQAKSKIIDIDQLLNTMMQKYQTSIKEYNDTMSFTYMSKHVLEEKIHKQYNNVYEKGAVIGMCLDILLRDLSEGKYGTQNLMKDLSLKYGKNKSFNDSELFKDIENLTFPEIGSFLKKHVGGTVPLPMSEILNKIGLEFSKENFNYEFSIGNPDFNYNEKTKRLYVESLYNVDDFGIELNYMIGDELLKINGKSLEVEKIKETLTDYYASIKEGDKVIIEILRPENNNKNYKTIELTAIAKKVKVTRENQINLIKNLTAKQTQTLKAWTGLEIGN